MLGLTSYVIYWLIFVSVRKIFALYVCYKYD